MNLAMTAGSEGIVGHLALDSALYPSAATGDDAAPGQFIKET